MNKHILIILLFVLGIGAAFYADEILAIFHGMSPLEALEFIFNYVLHAAVVTIVASLALGLPKLIQPWMRVLRRKRKALRRGEFPNRAPLTPRTPRLNKDALLAWLAGQMLKERHRRVPAQPQQSDDIRLDLS